MFTSFFYDISDGQKYCEQFLHTEKDHNKIVVIIDPPFGGMTDIIADGIGHLWTIIGTGTKIGHVPNIIFLNLWGTHLSFKVTYKVTFKVFLAKQWQLLENTDINYNLTYTEHCLYID